LHWSKISSFSRGGTKAAKSKPDRWFVIGFRQLFLNYPLEPRVLAEAMLVIGVFMMVSGYGELLQIFSQAGM